MAAGLNDVLNLYVKEMENTYDMHLSDVILYGSHAKGDFTLSSDIDLMILVHLDEHEIKNFGSMLVKKTDAFNEVHGTDIKPIVKNKELFQQWASVYPFYRNVSQEGVALYSAS